MIIIKFPKGTTKKNEKDFIKVLKMVWGMDSTLNEFQNNGLESFWEHAKIEVK